ncbi:transcriptional regulatory protein AlgP isoform X2 [Triticum aestivum]|uniref:transcriptional regulatory protein AlgP isoform X2 n=1 Tax=Triticum aestivum TaxID=4565 RepID=UPI001D031AE1|nr:transcriptional regulatory protein AlgP-like isoform X2 [Triticum aestivum]
MHKTYKISTPNGAVGSLRRSIFVPPFSSGFSSVNLRHIPTATPSSTGLRKKKNSPATPQSRTTLPPRSHLDIHLAATSCSAPPCTARRHRACAAVLPIDSAVRIPPPPRLRPSPNFASSSAIQIQIPSAARPAPWGAATPSRAPATSTAPPAAARAGHAASTLPLRRKPSPKPLWKAPEKPPAADPTKEDELQGAKKDAGAATAVGDGGARKGNSSPLPPPRKLQDAPAVNLNASCSSEASVESLRGRAPGGRTERGWSRPTAPKRGKAVSKVVEKHADVAEVAAPVTPEAVRGRSRCAWVTPTTGKEMHMRGREPPPSSV